MGIENSTNVLDPTLLLSGEDWRKISSRKFTKDRYILIYNLNRNPRIDAYAKELSIKTGLEVRYLSYQLHEFYKNGKMFCNPPVEDFLALIDGADYVITDSFHATAFSLNFNKEFVIVYPGKYSTRLQSILEILGLTNRVAKNERDILFVDGDDILTPWLLESAVQAVEDYDCDVIVGMINTTDKRPSIFPSREKNVKFELLDDHKKKELECHIFSKSCERWRPDQDGWEFNGEGCWAHFLKKEIALENQFIPGVAVGEDTIWALTMLNSSKDYRIGMLYEKWYYYIQNDYSVLNKYNPKIVGQLTLPVDILEKKYGASTGIVHAAYTDWLLMKLKHICFRAYLAEENTDPFNKKVSEFSKVLHTAPWIEVLNRRNTQPFKKRLKFFLYDKNIALYFYSCLKLVKRKKYDIEDGSRNESKN